MDPNWEILMIFVRWKAKVEIAGLTLGHAGNVCLAFVFFPVTRSSSLLRLLGLTSESSIKYHIWLGHITLALFSAHSLYFIIFWASTNKISQVHHFSIWPNIRFGFWLLLKDRKLVRQIVTKTVYQKKKNLKQPAFQKTLSSLVPFPWKQKRNQNKTKECREILPCCWNW